jgi:hypothetical protein
MEIPHTSFLLNNGLLLSNTPKRGNGVEPSTQIFLPWRFDIWLAHAHFASNFQGNYHFHLELAEYFVYMLSWAWRLHNFSLEAWRQANWTREERYFWAIVG